MDLIQTLMQAHGLKENQAQGAIGGIFRMVQDKLPAADSARLRELVPGLDGLAAAAPAPGGGGLMGGLASMMGGGRGGIDPGQILGLFSKLGISAGLIQPIAQTFLSWLQGQGAGGVGESLKKLMGR